MTQDYNFSRTLSVIIVIALIFILSMVLVPRMWRAIDPLSQGLEDENSVPLYQYNNPTDFTKDHIEFIQLETYTVYTKPKPEFSPIDISLLNSKGDQMKSSGYASTFVVYDSFGLRFKTEEYLSSGSIRNVLLSFKVDKTWMDSNGFGKDDIRFFALDGDWKSRLVTDLRDEPDAYVYQVGGLKDGSMAIVGLR